MSHQLTLQKIFADIFKEKLPFSYYASCQKVFSHVVSAIEPYMLDMSHDNIQAQFLLSKTMQLPMLNGWQVRFHNKQDDNNDFIICQQKTYCLWVIDEQLKIEEGEAQLEQQFLFDWNATAENLAEFNDLKTHHPVLAVSDYYNGEWDIPAPLQLEIQHHNLPAYVLNLKEVERNYQRFTQLLCEYKVYYSIKSNPDSKVLQLLYQLGSFFEAVSYSEIEMAFKAGASSEQVLFSAPVKRNLDIEKAHHSGINLFVADCKIEAAKLAKYAPGSRLLLRIKSSDNGAQIKLSSKYGLEIADVMDLFVYAQRQGLIPYGICFHVGGQNTLPQSWAMMQQKAHELFSRAKSYGFQLQFLNIGGGFPIKLNADAPDLAEIAANLTGTQLPGIKYCAEPGRFMVGHAAKLVCPVIAVAERGDGTWIYIDATVFGTLFMMGFHGFKYPITTNHYDLDVQPYHIASLSCDGADIVAKNILLPKGIDQNHLLIIHLVGAYSLPIFDVEYAGVSKTKIYYLT